MPPTLSAQGAICQRPDQLQSGTVPERLSPHQRKPLAVDLFCGLGGWSKGLLAEGWDVIGFDIERHRYPSRAFPEGHVEAPGADWNKGDSFNGTTEKRLREPPLTGGWDEYPGQLVLQDVLTLHGSQFKNCDLILCSPPCQEFSYMAMPWKRAKQIAVALRGNGDFPDGYAGSRTIAQLTALFDACFRIQREASEAAGRHIPMVVENVKGAQPWVGRAKANYGSFYLWGDVESVGGRVIAGHPVEFGDFGVRAQRGQKFNPDGTDYGTGSWFAVADSQNRGARKPDMLVETFNGHEVDHGIKNEGGSWFAVGSPGQKSVGQNPDGRKVPMNFHEHEKTGKPGRSFQTAAVESQKQPVWFNDDKRRATKCGGDWFGPKEDCSLMRSMSSNSSARKAASAMIAKIPPALSLYIAQAFKALKGTIRPPRASHCQ